MTVMFRLDITTKQKDICHSVHTVHKQKLYLAITMIHYNVNIFLTLAFTSIKDYRGGCDRLLMKFDYESVTTRLCSYYPTY